VFLYNRAADSGWDADGFVRVATLFGSRFSFVICIKIGIQDVFFFPLQLIERVGGKWSAAIRHILDPS